jgi:hypothetical protein
MRYKNKIDMWLKVMLHFSVLMFVPIIFTVPEDERYIMVIITVVMAIIIYPLFWGYCELRDDELYMKLSVFHAKVKYTNIKSIKLCKNWKSSMSMSRERIEIKEHNKGYILGTTYIGPEDRETFYDELKRRCYNLEN